MAQHAHVGGALVLVIGELAPLRKGQICYLPDLRRRPLEQSSAHLLALILHTDRAYAEHTHVLITSVGSNHVRQRAKRVYVIDVELLAREHFRRGPYADHWHVKYPEHVRAQPVVHPVIQPADHRRDRDHGAYADHDAKNRQP